MPDIHRAYLSLKILDLIAFLYLLPGPGMQNRSRSNLGLSLAIEAESLISAIPTASPLVERIDQISFPYSLITAGLVLLATKGV